MYLLLGEKVGGRGPSGGFWPSRIEDALLLLVRFLVSAGLIVAVVIRL